MPIHITGKLLKTEDKKSILKAVKEKWHVIYKGKMKRMTMDFSSESMRPERNKQASICKVLKESNCQSRILYLEKISFENEDTIKMVLKTILENLLLVDMLSNNC